MALDILVVFEKNSWVDVHLAASLEQMGHTVHRFHYGEFVGEFYEKKRHPERVLKNKQLVWTATDLLRQNKLDLIFCYVYDDFLLPEYAKQLAKLDVPLVNYNVDMACQWYRMVKTAKYFSVILCAQPQNMNSLAKYTSKVLLFPMAARASNATRSNSSFIPHAPVTFLGTPTLFRQQILSILSNHSIDLAIYGKYWKDQKTAYPYRKLEKTVRDLWNYGLARLTNEGIRILLDTFKKRIFPSKILYPHSLPHSIIHNALPDTSLEELFQQSIINLGFTRIAGDNPYSFGTYQMRLRDFEVPYSGGFYLVEKAPGYEDFFKLDQEVVTWSSPQELIDKITYYLDHEKERCAIAKAGKVRAENEHTWVHRFNKLFLELGISNT